MLVFHMAAGTVYTVCLTTLYTREMVHRCRFEVASFLSEPVQRQKEVYLNTDIPENRSILVTLSG